MDITPLINIPCTLIRVTDGGEDDCGNPTETTTETATVCWHERRGNVKDGAETGGVENWQLDQQDIYFLPGENVTGLDRVTLAAGTFDVLGPPHPHVHPRTQKVEFISGVIGRQS